MIGSLKPFVNDKKLWDAFLEELDSLISVEHRSLEQSNVEVGLYRSQGRVEAYKKLKKLRDKANGGE